MKFKPKHAFAALAIAMAGQAGAQVIQNNSTTGNSSMYFIALDDVAGRSYFSELVANGGSTTTGVLRMDDLINNPTGTWTVTLSGLNSFVGSSIDNMFGGFGGADTNATVGGGSSAATGNRRLLTSTATGSAAPLFTNSQVGGATAGGINYDSYIAQVGPECSTSPCIATNPGQAAYAGIQSGSAGVGLQWGFPSGAFIGDQLTGTIAWDIYLAVTSSITASAQATVTQSALHAVLDLATNTLTITGNVVPVPAAVWLLGSALLGFAGISRRKKGQIVDGAVAA